MKPDRMIPQVEDAPDLEPSDRCECSHRFSLHVLETGCWAEMPEAENFRCGCRGFEFDVARAVADAKVGADDLLAGEDKEG